MLLFDTKVADVSLIWCEVTDQGQGHIIFKITFL